MTTVEIKNPFSKIRAEQMGASAWRYFVKNPFKELISERPLVFEGSRGTGKSMFFICHSWREKWKEAASNNSSFAELIAKGKHIGFYYKADGRFTKSLSKRNVEPDIWISIFNTYINLVICREIIDFLLIAEKNGIIIEDAVINDILLLSSYILKIPQPNDFQQLRRGFDILIIQISQFTNYTEDERPVGTNPGQIIEVFTNSLKECSLFADATFHIFIDEYEVLTKLQQIQINTLVKQSNSNLVFDIGVITKGIYTHDTLSGQRIQEKDDFQLFNADTFFNYNNKDDYNSFLIDICKKRFEIAFQEGGIDGEVENKFLDIQFYLGRYNKNFDIERFKQKLSKRNVLKERLEKVMDAVHSTSYNKDDRRKFIEELYDQNDPIKSRMHLALLLRKGRDGILPEQLVNEKEQTSERYKSWCHNTNDAAIFLLSKELDIRKSYFGFNIFSLLSSGVVRSFLELVEFAFDFAYNNEFSFYSPREISEDEQTSAVYYASQFKLTEIESYEPSGFQLKNFVMALGKIFSNIQLNPNNTLGEPEQNHFFSSFINLKKNYPSAAQLLEEAIMNGVLQEEPSTKTKNPDSSFETLDYHLNHIYCPHFRISHNRKRKIFLKTEDLANLLIGTQETIETTIRSVSSSFFDKSSDQPNLFSLL